MDGAPGGLTYLDIASRGRNSPLRYILAVLLALVLSILIGAVVLVALQFTHLAPPDLSAQVLQPKNPVPFFIVNGVIFGLVAAGFALGARLVQGKRFTDLIGVWSWRAVATGFGLWVVLLVIAALVDFAMAPKGFRLTAGPGTAELALAAAAGLALQTFTEELVFRGYATQGLLLAFRRPLPACVVSGLIFGSLHIPNGVPQAISATAFGMVLAWIAIRQAGIAFTFGLHFANNLFGAVVLVSGSDVFQGSPGLFAQDTPFLMWWDVAVGTIALVLLAVGLARRTGRATRA